MCVPLIELGVELLSPVKRIRIQSVRRFAVVLLLFTPSTAAAQLPIDEGIQAILRGDYPAAVRILKPLAASTERPDPVAQFFMAILYESGRGVGRNESQACGLFRKAATPDNPFMPQSSALANVLLDRYGPASSLLCPAGGTWRDLPQATFTLGANHRIVFDDTSVTVHYNGSQHRIILGAIPGMAFLPIRYTPLNVTRPVLMRRHFIEYFTWVADTPANPRAWTLVRSLNEVIGGAYVMLPTSAELLRILAVEPPASFDANSLTRIRVNANGEAEWVITNGADQRSGVIPWQESR